MVVAVVSNLNGKVVRLPAGTRYFYLQNSRPAHGPTQPTVHWVPGCLSPGVKRQGREADKSSIVQRFRMSGLVPHIYLYRFMACTGIANFFFLCLNNELICTKL